MYKAILLVLTLAVLAMSTEAFFWGGYGATPLAGLGYGGLGYGGLGGFGRLGYGYGGLGGLGGWGYGRGLYY